MVTVSVVQLEVDDHEAVSDRIERVVDLLRGLSSVDLVVLPELWPVGAFNVERVMGCAESLSDSGFVAAMVRSARELRATLHAGSFPELHGDGVSNTSVVIAPDGQVTTTYRKIHLFGFDQGEAVLLAAGVSPALTETPLGVTGLATCYDLRFPELFRSLAAAGAESFVVPAGWPAARIGHWEVLTQARAVENLAPVIACNAVGTNGGVMMGGSSLVVGADGAILGQAGADSEEILTVQIDMTAAARWRTDFPALRDRRM